MLRMDETSMPRKNQASIRTIRVPLFLPLLVALKKNQCLSMSIRGSLFFVAAGVRKLRERKHIQVYSS